MKGKTPGRGRLTAVPLAVAYVAVPLGTAASHYTGGSGNVTPVAPWLLLAGLGTLSAMYRPRPGDAASGGFFFKLAMFVLMLAGMVFYAADILSLVMPYLPYLKEFSPFVFLLFCGLWVSTMGMPDRADFQRFGGLLGLFCVVDSVAEAAVYQSLPAIRWIGNADVLAAFLLVALCAGLKPGSNEGGCTEPDQGNRWWRLLTMLGLLLCLSRTGLFAAAWVVLCFGRGLFRWRLAYAILCALLIGGSFFLPPSPSDAVRYTDYWLWVEAMRLAAEGHPFLFTGFPIDQPLPVKFPVSMGAIWEAATGQPAVLGVHLTEVPSFWLRLLFAWGLAVPLLLLLILFILLFRRLTRMGAGLVAALFAQGMTTPLIYDPAQAIAICLGFILALSAPREYLSTRRESDEFIFDEEARSVESPDASSDDWSLRPL
ncbi:hypothetical protein HFN16_04305 [Pseudodesulfovibrio sp. zrk46]|nr:hypothetical protein HFN16_04305 [Pseudodesulfovibrio sp. zrk46]